MAKYSSADMGFFLVGGYSILGAQTEITDRVEKPTEETTVLGDAWEQNAQTGIRKGMLAQKGFYDDAADGNNAALLATDPRPAALGFKGNTAGLKFAGFAGTVVAMYHRIFSRGALHRADADYAVTGEIEEGTIVAPLAARAGNITTTGVDNSASSANGGAGYLQVSALTLGGYTSITVKIRHSTDDISYSDLITFTNVTGVTGERVTVAGTINRYVNSQRTRNGAGAGDSITDMVGLVRA